MNFLSKYRKYSRKSDLFDDNFGGAAGKKAPKVSYSMLYPKNNVSLADCHTDFEAVLKKINSHLKMDYEKRPSDKLFVNKLNEMIKELTNLFKRNKPKMYIVDAVEKKSTIASTDKIHNSININIRDAKKSVFYILCDFFDFQTRDNLNSLFVMNVKISDVEKIVSPNVFYGSGKDKRKLHKDSRMFAFDMEFLKNGSQLTGKDMTITIELHLKDSIVYTYEYPAKITIE